MINEREMKESPFEGKLFCALVRQTIDSEFEHHRILFSGHVDLSQQILESLLIRHDVSASRRHGRVIRTLAFQSLNLGVNLITVDLVVKF